MDIRVRSVTGGTYPLSVRGEVSVSSLTQDISLLTGLPPNQLQLFSCARLLREDAPVHISPEVEIQFLTKIRAGTLLYLKTFTGKIITIEVNLQYDTVEFVKNKVEEKIGVGKDEMILIFNDTELKNDQKLCSYNIMREDTIHLVAKGKGEMKKQPSVRGTGEGEGRKSGCCVII